MKKTLIALMALASVACAETLTLTQMDNSTVTFDSTTNTSGYAVIVLNDAAITALHNNANALNQIFFSFSTKDGENDEVIGTGNAQYSGNKLLLINKPAGSISGAATYYSKPITETNLKTDDIVSAVMTIAITGAGTGDSISVSTRNAAGELNTYSWTFNANHADMVYDGYISGAKFNESYVSEAYYGFDSWTADGVAQLGATFATPEPATATLSLLALAGLAARRRRH